MFCLQQKFIFLFILGLTNISFSQQNLFLTSGTTKARSLALGGAYTSIEDDIVSAGYNPATLSLYQATKDSRLTVYLNPVAPMIVYYGQIKKNNHSDQNHSPSQQFLKTITLLIKSLVFTGRFVDIALVLNEQVIEEKYLLHQNKFFDDCDLWDNSYHTFTSRIKLAERVSIGVAGSIYLKKIEDKRYQGVGFSYGIMLKPAHNMNVGLAFIDFPENLPEIRLPVERMIDQTMNIGVSYKPTTSTTLSFDLRNLTEDDQPNVREAHLGIEQTIFSIFAIRGGLFQERFTRDRTFSGGLGLFDSNLLFSKENHFNHPQFLLNYSFLYQKRDSHPFRWHVLSILFRI